MQLSQRQGEDLGDRNDVASQAAHNNHGKAPRMLRPGRLTTIHRESPQNAAPRVVALFWRALPKSSQRASGSLRRGEARSLLKSAMSQEALGLARIPPTPRAPRGEGWLIFVCSGFLGYLKNTSVVVLVFFVFSCFLFVLGRRFTPRRLGFLAA